MRTSNLKQWDTFYNINGFLCLVHKIGGGKAQIINYNTSFYNITISSGWRANYRSSNKTPNEFFADFPVPRFFDRDALRRYLDIKDRYNIGNKALKRRRLLLLC